MNVRVYSSSISNISMAELVFLIQVLSMLLNSGKSSSSPRVVNISFITDRDAVVGSEHADAVSAEIVRQRLARARPVLLETVTELFRTIPSGFRRSTGAPPEAVAHVLARAVR